jgi:hypothetical protein
LGLYRQNLKKLEVSEYMAEMMENDGIFGHIPGMWKKVEKLQI